MKRIISLLLVLSLLLSYGGTVFSVSATEESENRKPLTPSRASPRARSSK